MKITNEMLKIKAYREACNQKARQKFKLKLEPKQVTAQELLEDLQ